MKYILIINSGSSSLKVKLFDEGLKEVFKAKLERIGLNHSFLDFQEGKRINFSSGVKDHPKALKEIIKILPNKYYRNIKLVGHRIVHGGEEFTAPTVLNKSVVKQISGYNDFAPIHNPINLLTALAAIKEFPNLKHIGVFDTQFFKDLPKTSYLYGLPFKYYRKFHLRKYGFHGLSHENMLKEAQKFFGRKNLNLITCHLGQGVSITAIKEGKVWDTSMGLTPLSGAVMNSRSGDLDPFIPLFLMKELKLTPTAVYQELNFQAGLKGLCGSGDFREILTIAGFKVPDFKLQQKITKQKRLLAELALKIYLYNIKRYVASYVGLLGKVDAVVFSGGVGENRQNIRSAIVGGVHFINRPKIIVVKANEELMMAKKIVGR
jgi:acetate kinase